VEITILPVDVKILISTSRIANLHGEDDMPEGFIEDVLHAEIDRNPTSVVRRYTLHKVLHHWDKHDTSFLFNRIEKGLIMFEMKTLLFTRNNGIPPKFVRRKMSVCLFR